MRKILLTGAGGLIGSHLLPLLSERYEVHTISRKEMSGTNLYLDFSKEWDSGRLPDNLDIIIHLAQSENFRDFPDRAVEVFNVNTNSTLKLIDHACKTGVKTFIYASSGGVYGHADVAFDESSDIIYRSDMGFYLATKQCSEMILDNYASLLQVIQLRPFFVYGKGQKKDMLIPRLIHNIKNGVPLHLQGDEGITINPTHISDAVAAIKASLDLAGSHKINIAGPESLTIRRMGEIIGDLVQRKPQFIFEKKKARNLIGGTINMSNQLVKSKVLFKDGIRDLIE